MVTMLSNLTVAQLTGLEDLEFVVNFTRLVPEKHLVGRRMYAEVGLDRPTKTRTPVSTSSRNTRLFVDFTNLADLSAYPPGVSSRKRFSSEGVDSDGDENAREKLNAQYSKKTLWVSLAVLAVSMLVGWAIFL